jgi:hypothetical protein
MSQDLSTATLKSSIDTFTLGPFGSGLQGQAKHSADPRGH